MGGPKSPQGLKAGALWAPLKTLEAPQRPPGAPRGHQKDPRSPKGRFHSYLGKTYMELQGGPFFFLRRRLGRPKKAHGGVSVGFDGHLNLQKKQRRGLLGPKRSQRCIFG